MIRYDVDWEELEANITQSWFRRATTRTNKFRGLGAYTDKPAAIWSEIKPLYMAIQHDKCIFCERKFESEEYGRIEHDLEHFRPKSSVVEWPRVSDEVSYNFSTGGDGDGYYWLAYDLENYAAACGVCNSTLKSNCFPIKNQRGAPDEAVADLTEDEEPFLSYPLGEFDLSPEELVTFVATTAVPVFKRGHKKRRGEIMIEFFKLNKRDILHKERAMMIALIGLKLEKAERGGGTMSVDEVIEVATQPAIRHAGCLRAFTTKWIEDPTTAKQIVDACSEYYDSTLLNLPAAPPDV